MSRVLCPKSPLVFLIGIQILLSIFCLQEAQTQQVADPEISDLEGQLRGIETTLVSIDTSLRSLNERLNIVTNEKNELTQELIEEKPKGFLDRIRSVFDYRKRRKQERLMTESQDLADRISELQKEREPLVNIFVALADELIRKCSLRITALMEVVRQADQDNDVTARDEAMRRVSSLWQLAEGTTALRDRYAPGTVGPERTIDYSALLSNNPEELRLVAAILKDYAAEASAKATQLEREIEKLQSRSSLLKRIVELSEEMQRRDEERGAAGIGTANIPWSDDVATKREIEDINERIDELSDKKQGYQDNAESFERQSKELGERASQIDAELKRKSEDD